MTESHTIDLTQSPAFRRLEQFVTEVRSQGVAALGNLADFELAVRSQLLEVGREIVAAELGRYDMTAPEIVVAGVTYRRALRSRQTYMSACGPISLERQLYCPRGGGGRAICPLEERVGMVGGFWTPRAAYEAAALVTEVTPGEAEGLLRELTGMRPSKTSLDRLPKTLSGVWEARREQFEADLRASETIPAEAAMVAVSLDGVMAPMRDGERARKRARADKQPKGPAGYREVGCATVTFYDAAGDRLSTLRWARMPEGKKATLHRQLAEEVQAVLVARPDLKLIKLADGAESNWDVLGTLPAGTDVVDFFHACEHLKRALDAAHGERTVESQAAFAKYRLVLKKDPRGVQKVIRMLSHLASRGRGRVAVRRECGYFRRQRARMRYASYRRRHFPIASGVVEAACKTLVTQRLKRSGMSWLQAGGQAILTLRGLRQSDRWDRAWTMLAAAFRTKVYTTHTKGHLAVLEAA